MKALRIIVFGSFAFVILLGIGAAMRGDISGSDTYYDTSFETAYENYEPESSTEEIPYEEVTEQQMQPAPVPQPASEPAYSDTHQTAPMPEESFDSTEILGKWVDDSEPDQVKVVHFYMENNQLMFRHYFIVPGNSIGINIANEVTEWDCCDGIVSVMANQGSIYCHRGTDSIINQSFYYGFDGTNVMYNQEDGTAFYRAE